MKLVQILAKELKEWSEGAKYYAQDYSGRAFPYKEKPKLARKVDEPLWSSVGQLGGAGYISCRRATDHATAIVTRADWEAEKARIAGRVDGGWKRHRGGKQPVADGVRVDYRMRNGRHGINERSELLDWVRSDESPESDIMAYRIHKPAEQPGPVSEEAIQVGIDAADAGKLTTIDEVKARWQGKRPPPKLERALKQAEEIRIAAHAPDPILIIRDRIRTLDTKRAEVESTYQRQISEITQERESLVQKLAGEGFALVEVVVQPVEDIMDWTDWRIGDVLTSTADGWGYTSGKTYKFLGMTTWGTARTLDDNGKENGMMPVCFAWHSRPAT